MEIMPSIRLNQGSTDMLFCNLFWINKFIDLSEICQNIVYHNKNERLIITTMLEIVQVLSGIIFV